MQNQSQKISLPDADVETLKFIQKLMSQAEQEFTKLSDSSRDQLLQFSTENHSINHCLRWGASACDQIIEECEKPAEAQEYGYYINLDERGEFNADVRDRSGKTVFEIKAGSDNQDESSIFEDGFMSDKTDIDGLCAYLQDIGIIPKNGKILSMSDFEEESRPAMRG